MIAPTVDVLTLQQLVERLRQDPVVQAELDALAADHRSNLGRSGGHQAAQQAFRGRLLGLVAYGAAAGLQAPRRVLNPGAVAQMPHVRAWPVGMDVWMFNGAQGWRPAVVRGHTAQRVQLELVDGERRAFSTQPDRRNREPHLLRPRFDGQPAPTGRPPYHPRAARTERP